MATWYWQGTVDGNWDDTGNWTDDYAGTGNNPATIPWTTPATKDDDIEEGELASWSYPYIGSSIVIGNGFKITGVCSLVVDNYGIIGGGTYTGVVYNGWIVSGGLFTAYGCYSTGEISGGDWTGDFFYSSMGSLITDGRFSGYNMTNEGSIFNGFFTGANFTNDLNAEIWGGGFRNDTFSNNANIFGGIYQAFDFQNSGFLAGGIIASNYFSDNSYNSMGAFWLSKGSIKYNGQTYKATGVANPAGNYNQLKNIETSDILGSGLI
jgi:hypothetical protein